jgi:hypothetical protein
MWMSPHIRTSRPSATDIDDDGTSLRRSSKKLKMNTSSEAVGDAVVPDGAADHDQVVRRLERGV